ncbi:hypothetical protein AC579_5043 [Pseudocercospora musae]|uniref:Uncharacterized protein n=1 Tax=Pseudocercospora musae TaxID=113226 RepID=A0A139H3B7_9PEZI|nr:hypothetical protein AC579_5043 [Pseudocercospora musae]
MKRRRGGKFVTLSPTNAEVDVLVNYFRAHNVNAAQLPTPLQVVDLIDCMGYTSGYAPLDASLAELVVNIIDRPELQSRLGNGSKNKLKAGDKMQLKKAVTSLILDADKDASRTPIASSARDSDLPPRPDPRSVNSALPDAAPAERHASGPKSFFASVGAMLGAIGQGATKATEEQTRSSPSGDHALLAASATDTEPARMVTTVTSHLTGASLALTDEDHAILDQLFTRLHLGTPNRLSVDSLSHHVSSLQAAVEAQEEEIQRATEEWKRLRGEKCIGASATAKKEVQAVATVVGNIDIADTETTPRFELQGIASPTTRRPSTPLSSFSTSSTSKSTHTMMATPKILSPADIRAIVTWVTMFSANGSIDAIQYHCVAVISFMA